MHLNASNLFTYLHPFFKQKSESGNFIFQTHRFFWGKHSPTVRNKDLRQDNISRQTEGFKNFKAEVGSNSWVSWVSWVGGLGWERGTLMNRVNHVVIIATGSYREMCIKKAQMTRVLFVILWDFEGVKDSLHDSNVNIWVLTPEFVVSGTVLSMYINFETAVMCTTSDCWLQTWTEC